MGILPMRLPHQRLKPQSHRRDAHATNLIACDSVKCFPNRRPFVIAEREVEDVEVLGDAIEELKAN